MDTDGIREQPCISYHVPGVLQRSKCPVRWMKHQFKSSVNRSIRLEQDVDKIIRKAHLDVSDLIEAGLISLAKYPDSRNNQILQAAIRIEEDRVSYHSKCLSELVAMKEQIEAPKIPEKAPTTVKADILVRGIKTRTLYWAVQSIVENCKDILSIADPEEDTGDDYLQIFSIADIPECDA